MFALVLVSTLLNVALIYAVTYMAWDKSYGCFTRAAFNIMYPVLKVLGYTFIAGDIDKFKAWNTRLGHEAVNHIVYGSIRRLFSMCRLGDMVFRLYSGDEFIIAVRTNDTQAVITHVAEAFAVEGMTITLVVIDWDIDTTMLKILENK